VSDGESSCHCNVTQQVRSFFYSCHAVRRHLRTLLRVKSRDLSFTHQHYVWYPEAGKITFILTSNHILDHCSKIDLRSRFLKQLGYFQVCARLFAANCRNRKQIFENCNWKIMNCSKICKSIIKNVFIKFQVFFILF
jgi:hypothetical protein